MYEITLQVLSIENINKKISQDGRKVCYLDIWMGFVWFYFSKKMLIPYKLLLNYQIIKNFICKSF